MMIRSDGQYRASIRHGSRRSWGRGMCKHSDILVGMIENRLKLKKVFYR